MGEDRGVSLSLGLVLGQCGDPNARTEGEHDDLFAEGPGAQDQGDFGADEGIEARIEG